MNKPEQQFWTLVKGHLPGDVSRIENIADVGTPDITGAYNGNDYWIELKVSENIRKIISPDKLCRPAQIVWHTRRGKHDSIILILTRYPNTITIHRYANKKYHILENFMKIKNKWPWEIFTRCIINETIKHNSFYTYNNKG
jgi:hypothetical protein